ncbi:MAG: response regulator, partial [Fibrobacter sp.]|nr:response regulator [Fibrobacter sp.]
MKTVMVIEDQEDMQALYKILIRRIKGAELVAQIMDAEDALPALQKIHPDLSIIDITLPGKNGIELAKESHELYPQMKILIATGHDPEAYYEDAIKAGANDFI